MPYLQWGAQSQAEGGFPPLHPLFFHYPHFISVSIRHWNVIQPAQQAIRIVCGGGGGTTFKAIHETLSYSLPLCNPLHPDCLMKLAKAKDFSFWLYIMSAGASIWMPKSFFDLDTEERGVFGTLHESGMQFLEQLVSVPPLGVKGRTLLWQTSNTHSWCLRLATLITSSVRDITGGSHLLPNMSTGRSWNITTAANSTMPMSRNFRIDIVRQLLAKLGIQIEKWGKCRTTSIIMAVSD